MSLACKRCGGQTAVVETYDRVQDPATRRRRQCQECGKRETSLEFWVDRLVSEPEERR